MIAISMVFLGCADPHKSVDYSFIDISKSKYPRFVVDINNDHRADIVGFGKDGVYVSLSTGSGFLSPARWTRGLGANRGWGSGRYVRSVADVDGDGLLDVVGFGYDGVMVGINRGNRFYWPKLKLRDFGYKQGWRNEKHIRTLADVNGDGRADIVGFASNGVFVSLSLGYGYKKAEEWSKHYGLKEGWQVGRHIRLLKDVNGDGKADIVAFGNEGVLVSLSTGKSFKEPRVWSKNFGSNEDWEVGRTARMVVSVYGVDNTSIYAFREGSTTKAVSTGNSFEAEATQKYNFDESNLNTKKKQTQTTRVSGNDVGNCNGYPLWTVAVVDPFNSPRIVKFGRKGVYVLQENPKVNEIPIWIKYFSENMGWNCDKHIRVMADVTGDGLADVVGIYSDGVYTAVSTGKNFWQYGKRLDAFGYNQGWGE